MKRFARWAVAAGLLAAAIVVAAPLASSALTRQRARGAEVSFCGPALAAKAAGSWVRLTRCGVDMFHEAFLVDAEGAHTHRLVPLRPPDGSALEPGTLALAVPIDPDHPGVFRIRPGPHSSITNVADLDETTAVVRGSLDRLEGKLEESAAGSGLAPNPTVVELREPGSFDALRQRLAIAGGLVLLAILILLAGRSGRARDVYVDGDRRPVRWGLIFVLVLVGVVALARGVQWYFVPIRTAEPAASAQQPIPSPAAPAAPASTAPLPVATPEELALLASASHENRMRGAATLRTRAATP